MQCKLCLLALLPGVPGVSVPEHHHELGHPHHGAVGGAHHRARAQQRPAAERVETSQAEIEVFGLGVPGPGSEPWSVEFGYYDSYEIYLVVRYIDS